jgi:membrane-anchored protein YejM (alkaline phosphatase superfamily)
MQRWVQAIVTHGMRSHSFRRCIDVQLSRQMHTYIGTHARIITFTLHHIFPTHSHHADASMVNYLDTGVGKIVDSLKAKGMWENTIWFFQSDNGTRMAAHHIARLSDSTRTCLVILARFTLRRTHVPEVRALTHSQTLPRNRRAHASSCAHMWTSTL